MLFVEPFGQLEVAVVHLPGVLPRWYSLSRAAAQSVKSGKRISTPGPNRRRISRHTRLGETLLSRTKRSVCSEHVK
jgi:hypothetical protein